MKSGRAVILVVCDGMSPDWTGRGHTPFIDSLREKSLWCANHDSVFPSVTRNAAAAITTGCLSRKHGLHGNLMALNEDGRLMVRDVGRPDFRTYMRRATGMTLRVPSLPERIRELGSSVVYSNVSPGAAYFLDPDNFGWTYHRAGSFGPGGKVLHGPVALDITHDMAGDADMTERFCRDIATRPDLSLGILWLSCPDLAAHYSPLGSPEHVLGLRSADACVERVAETVASLRRRSKELLFLVGSDHGMESVHGFVDIQAELRDAGFSSDLEAGVLAVAAQGTSALLYALPEAMERLDLVLDALKDKPWVGRILRGDDLPGVGHLVADGLAAALDMKRMEAANSYEVMGMRWATKNGVGDAPTDCGMHGGLGPDESRAMLLVQGEGFEAYTQVLEPTHLVDIAPTILTYLGLPLTGMEGVPLLERASGHPPCHNLSEE